MPPVGFEPTISAGERPKTYALDRTATRTGNIMHLNFDKYNTEKLHNIYKNYQAMCKMRVWATTIRYHPIACKIKIYTMQFSI